MEQGPAWARRETIETSLSAFGAGFIGLGAGLALGIREPLFGWALVGLGLATHGLGMVFLHRRRRGHGDKQPRWMEAAYWACWILLVVVVVFLTWRAWS